MPIERSGRFCLIARQPGPPDGQLHGLEARLNMSDAPSIAYHHGHHVSKRLSHRCKKLTLSLSRDARSYPVGD